LVIGQAIEVSIGPGRNLQHSVEVAVERWKKTQNAASR
jgi:hypothetical protein